jgi:hypothetical protein
VLDHHRRPSASRWIALTLVGAIVALACAWGAAGARADGDPASDVLISENVFVPIELNIDRQTELLAALLSDSARAGFPIRVALIAAPDDLGTVTSLWRNPRAYSQYLGTELSLAYHGQVAVVMPNGIYVWPGSVAPTHAEEVAASELPAPGSGPALVTGAVDAVESLAAAQGHPLATTGIRIVPPVAATGSSQPEQALALGIGAALILVAWGASLRARPWRFGRGAAA